MVLHINEIFYSIQGESRWAGFPCAFVRLAGCNLRCTWCDTEYAFGAGQEMSLDQVIARVTEYPCRLVEITGGEPLLQGSCVPLMERFLEMGYRVLLETGGSISIRDVPPVVVKVLDVKCPGSGESDRQLFENFDYLRPTDDVKFVVRDRHDFDYALAVIRDHDRQRRAGLIFSPVWGQIGLPDLAQWLLATGLNARLQVQLHKVIWGPNARGV